MKAFVAWGVLLWVSLVLENSRPDVFPATSLMLPLAICCVFWLRTGTGTFLAGSALILRWLLQPETPPVEVALVLWGSVWVLQAERRQRLAGMSHGRLVRTETLMLFVLTLCTIVAHHSLGQSVGRGQTLLLKTVVSFSVLALTWGVGRLASEFGLRQRLN